MAADSGYFALPPGPLLTLPEGRGGRPPLVLSNNQCFQCQRYPYWLPLDMLPGILLAGILQTAILMREPEVIWVPVVNATHFHVITIIAQTELEDVSRTKRLGNHSSCYCGHCASNGKGVAGTVSLTQRATMVETLNQVITKSAEVLYAQEIINQHLNQAIHILKQQIDLWAEELTLLKDMSLLMFEPQYQAICLTPYKVFNTSSERFQVT